MGNYRIFAYVFRVKPKVVIPEDPRKLKEAHYVCIHREPVAELAADFMEDVLRHFHQVSLSPAWYKRGLTPLKYPDVVWYNGMGYLVLPTGAKYDFYGHLGGLRRLIGPLAVVEKQLDPEKILTCKV